MVHSGSPWDIKWSRLVYGRTVYMGALYYTDSMVNGKANEDGLISEYL